MPKRGEKMEPLKNAQLRLEKAEKRGEEKRNKEQEQ